MLWPCTCCEQQLCDRVMEGVCDMGAKPTFSCLVTDMYVHPVFVLLVLLPPPCLSEGIQRALPRWQPARTSDIR